MANTIEILSVTPQRLRCYICGTYSEDPQNWFYRLKLTGHSAVCPACVPKAEYQISEQSTDPNFAGALALGALASVAGWAAWGAAREIEAAPLMGWLVGWAVVRGSGGKRGHGLQRLSEALTAIGSLAGLYVMVNLVLQHQAAQGSYHWLSPADFCVFYATLIMQGTQFAPLVAIVIAIWVAYVFPRPDRLVSKLPSKLRRWF